MKLPLLRLTWRALFVMASTSVLVLLSACAVDPRTHADALARPAGLTHEQVRTQGFTLTAYVRITRSDLPLNVYIEGDGMAWRNRHQPSDDPTPNRALGLTLAAADLGANVLYLARPCQFTPIAANPQCDVTYWTDKRFAPEVVAAVDESISHYATRTPGQRINIIGYSGGGAVAVLVAARRQDVASIRTVAGNLDIEAINRLHKVSAMPDSLNPIDVAARVANIAQIHLSGSRDEIVPAAIARSFATRVGPCARVQVVNGLSHEGGWAAAWPQLLAIAPPCSPGAEHE